MKRDRDRDRCAEKGNMWTDHQPDSGMDELFAVLGYKVKSSDMADVAQKLEQLEMAMGSTTMEDGVSVLSSTDTVHYNPSDLSGWVESMLSELSNSWSSFDLNPNQIGISGESSSVPADQEKGQRKFICDDDLSAIPGGAIFRSNQKEAEDDDDAGNTNKNINNADRKTKNKKMKSEENGSGLGSGTEQQAVVLLDSQETGVRLVHTLMACAEAVQQGNLKLADALVKQVGILAVSQVGAMRKVATYFGEALARKIYEIHPQQDQLEWDALQMHFYETGPYLKFAHFTSNQAILEAFTGATRVHVIDFSLKQGLQWPALMQALALQHGGPPLFRLTGVQLAHQSAKPDSGLEHVGWKLNQFAGTIGVQFKFQTVVVESLADLNARMQEITPAGNEEETVAVSSVLELHRLLSRPGAIDEVLRSVRGMNPKIVTIVEQEANHNGSIFLDRFNEALHYYSTMFDSLDISRGTMGPEQEQDLVMTEVYLGKQICNVVACEGQERVERHETLAQWRVRMRSAGFQPVHLGSNGFKQASMLLALSASGDGYRVDEHDGCLTLGWHTRPLIATSAWQPAASK